MFFTFPSLLSFSLFWCFILFFSFSFFLSLSAPVFFHLAAPVIDSIGRPTSGLLEGRRTFLGQYDECVHAQGDAFAGMYCVVQLHLPADLSDQRGAMTATGKTATAATTEVTETIVKLGICVPSTCTDGNLLTIAQRCKLIQVLQTF